MAEQGVLQAELTEEGSDADRSSRDQWHEVQRVIFGLNGKPEKLYFRWRPSIRGDVLARTPPKSHRLSLDAERGVLLNFCTLANTFYESYWLQYTTIQGIAFRITVKNGKGWIRLIRIMPSKERVQIALQLFDTRDAPITLTLVADRTNPNSAGILFVEMMATEGQLQLSHGAWLALCERPITLPSLHIGICTYNRARFVNLLLHTLNADDFVAELIDDILLVSQGEDTQEIIDGMADLTPDFARKVRIIRQGNIGGSGGFGRVMYEVSKSEDGVCVLMDDDIEIEPESLSRAVRFHALLRQPACVGGQMLELNRPSIVFETGAKAHLSRFDCANVAAIDARRIKGIRQFVQPTECTFNGWWFFLFGTSLIRKHGFPLPLFVRADDTEYGLRLLRNNIPTITLPGVFVWHDSAKLIAGSPFYYYSFRNFLIVAAIYNENFSISGVIVELWNKWSNLILVHDYACAHLSLKAVADFLKGPRALQSTDPQKLHQEVIEATRRHSTSTVSSGRTLIIAGTVRGLEKPQRESKGLRALRLLHALLARVQRPPTTLPLVDPVKWHWLAISTHNYYALKLADPTKLLVFRRSRGHVAHGFIAIVWTTLRVMMSGRKVQREWKSAFPELTSMEFWERYLRAAGVQNVADRHKGQGSAVEPQRSAVL